MDPSKETTEAGRGSFMDAPQAGMLEERQTERDSARREPVLKEKLGEGSGARARVRSYLS